MTTPIGPLSLLARDDVLVAAGFTADPAGLRVRLSPALRDLPLAIAKDLGQITKAMTAYFEGDLTAPDALEVYQPSTPTRERLHGALRTVPPGTTISYAELAVRAGLPRTAARAAGSACAQNLIAPVVPCHRILPAAGGFGGYYYGLPVKQWLVGHEA